VALVVGLLGIAVAALLPFAPVVAERSTLTWPGPGEQPVSTTAFLTPYRPAELHVALPCSAVQAALAAPDRTVLFTTAALAEGQTGTGLLVDSEDGQLRFAVNGRDVATAAPPPIGCDVRVDATRAGPPTTTITAGGVVVANLPGEPVPEVFAFATDLTPVQALGTRVTARTQNWYESVPTPTKYALLAGFAGLAVAALVLLARAAPPRVRERRSRAPVSRLRWLVDLAVIVGLAGWMIIGPQTDDDGYATVTIRNSLESGDIGNYYRWFNASEAPFTLVQYLLQPLAAWSAAPLWLRVPSVLAGVAAWFVVSRGVLGAVLPVIARTWWVRSLAALSFLGWWLPFNLGVRPEPFVALTVVGVLAILLRATAPGTRHQLLGIGAAAALAGVALAITTTGILVFAAVLVLVPRIWRVLTDAGRASLGRLATRVALLGCLASTGLVLMFADQTLQGVREATAVHTEIGPNFAWYEELNRYSALLGIDHQSSATKRLPVLLTLTLLVVVTMLILRRVRALQDLRDAHLLTACVAAGFALLWLTPSKWSHHFGSLAGLGAPFLVVALLVVVRAARQRSTDRAILVIGTVGGGLVALAAGLAFSGPNAWFLYGSYGVPWLDGPIRPLGVPLSNPLLWAAGGAALVAAAALVARARGRAPKAAALATLTATPALIGVPALAASIAVLAVSFTVALLQQTAAGSYSLAGQNLDHLTGSSCGIVDKVEVMPDVPGGILRTAGGNDELEDFVPRSGYLLEEPPPDAPGTGNASQLWGSLAGGGASTGSLTSRWFLLPDLGPDREVAVSAAGRTGAPNRLALEFGRSDPGGVTLLAKRLLDDGRSDPQWRALSVPAAAVPEGADRVRIRAADTSTDPDGWLAVTGPRLLQVVPLQEFLGDRTPVLVDWPMSWTTPCVELPVVSNGIAESPRVHITAPDAYAAMSGIVTDPVQGGSFAGIAVTGRSREVPSRLTGEPGLDWGAVRLLDYPVARDGYQLTTDPVRQWGWQGNG
jgi:arabinosyltransferase C